MFSGHARCHPATLGPCYPPGRLQRKAAGEDCQATKEHLLLFGEQVITPGNGVVHHLLPGGQVASAAGQQRQTLVVASKQGGGREHLDPTAA